MKGRMAGLLGLLAALVATDARAHVPLRSQIQSGSPRPIGNVTDTGTVIDGNLISMFVTNVGSFAFDLPNGASGLEFPKGSTKTAIFAAGLWMGAQVAGQTRVTVAEYSMEFTSGTMQPGGTPTPDQPAFRVFKVDREDQTNWADWVANAAPLGAPVDTVDGEVVPGIIGDQTLWAVFNDGDPNAHSNNAGSTAPLGVEVQLTAFAFNQKGALEHTVFLKYKIINKGGNQLDNTFVSLWSDPDLGGAGDDLVGVDVDKSMGYVYNATNRDNLYGSTPPAVGFDFFQGPIADDDTTVLGLASFNKYINGTDPNSFTQSYNYMQGLDADGNPVINPVTNEVTTYFHDGDPVAGTGWLDSNPADRRFMLSAGPFTMMPGDTQEVVAAIIVGDGPDRLASISALRFYDRFAQAAFDVDFDLPNPPSKPIVEAQPLDRRVVLSWGSISQQPDSTSSYVFEGYNIWQGATASGPWKRIATYDVVNGVASITDEEFDPAVGLVVKPVQFGTDSGVNHSIEITQDAIRGGGLNNGTQYYFSVTAYSYDPLAAPKTLENTQGVAGFELNTVAVIPQKPTAGSDLGTVATSNVTLDRFDTNLPPTTDVVTVEVVNPNAVQSCNYEVFYTPTEDPHPIYAGNEVLNYWNLRRICPDGSDADSAPDTTVLLANQLNKTGDNDYLVVDGLKVRVSGAYKAELQDVFYTETGDLSEVRDMQPADFGLAFYGGGADYAINFFGSTIDPVANPEQFTTVELRFDSTATQKAYMYRREVQSDGATAPANGRHYAYDGFYDVNFQVWDTVNDRQLDAAFVEKVITDADAVPTGEIWPTNDHTWRPSENSDGDREYLFISATTYSDTPKPEYEVDDAIGALSGAPNIPFMYVLTGHAADTDNPYPDNGEKITYVWANPGQPNDVFRFTGTAGIKDNSALAASRLDQVRVVPNPYYARSAYELNQFDRQIRFMNLPARCTIRIFNLAGELVRTLEKDDPNTSLLTWDAETSQQLPVGSGIYIFHIDAPGVGSSTGRMVVFMEKERLNEF
jgi:hypothetical protein